MSWSGIQNVRSSTSSRMSRSISSSERVNAPNEVCPRDDADELAVLQHRKPVDVAVEHDRDGV